MQGAKQYAGLFKTGQYGRLYITSGSHARGTTFRIQLLPEGEKAIPNGSNNTCLNKDAVEVYGILGGNSGWTEYYGWIHKGKWCEDFENMVIEREIEIENETKLHQEYIENEKALQNKKIETLLNKY